jgi:hypothetical protein
VDGPPRIARLITIIADGVPTADGVHTALGKAPTKVGALTLIGEAPTEIGVVQTRRLSVSSSEVIAGLVELAVTSRNCNRPSAASRRVRS